MSGAARMSGTARMVRWAYPVIIAAVAVLFGAGLWWGLPLPDDSLLSGDTQGTTYSIKIAVPLKDTERRVLEETISRRLDEIDRVLSVYRDDSELSKFNRVDGVEAVPASTELIEVFQLARSVGEMSGGAFDVTVAPLVKAWGFGPSAAGGSPTPSEAALAELRSRVGYDKVEADESKGTLRKAVAGVTCDLNAIAQGYTVDKIAGDLLGLGYRNFVVEVGGEVRAKGRSTRGIPWQVGIEKPVFEGREVEQVIPLSDMSLSTSGDYRNYVEKVVFV
jgi:thiamine biosynthesis lipoprotein